MNTEREKIKREWKAPHGFIRFTFFYHTAQKKVYCLTAVRDAFQDTPEVVELVEIKERNAEETVESIDIPLTEFQQRIASGIITKITMKPIF